MGPAAIASERAEALASSGLKAKPLIWMLGDITRTR
jgi:hypothetical protein